MEDRTPRSSGETEEKNRNKGGRRGYGEGREGGQQKKRKPIIKTQTNIHNDGV